MSLPGSGAPRRIAVIFFASLFVLALFSALSLPALGRTRNAAHDEDWADTQYATAGKMRDALEARPDTKRMRVEYLKVVEAYRRVYLGAPASGKADPSAATAADVLTEMGRQFKDAKVLHAAIKQYEFLRREYPGSKSRFRALYAIAQIYQNDLNDPAHALPVFQEFVKKYPSNAQTPEARQAIAALITKTDEAKSAGEDSEDATRVGAKKNDVKPDNNDAQALQQPDASNKTADADDTSSADDSDAPDGQQNPARITAIRYSGTGDKAKVEIFLSREVKFKAQRLENPNRIFFNLYGAKLASSRIGKELTADDSPVKAVRASDFKPGEARVVLEVANDVDFKAAYAGPSHRLIISLDLPKAAAKRATAASTVTDAALLDGMPAEKSMVDAGPVAAVPAKHVTVASAKDDFVGREAKPTADGERSLIRALGLKIGRIVIDPGHGGHDTGTIGPHGLLEKDLVLDVSRRLGKLLEARLGAEVVYTRSDDTFIPLEMRTAIANREQADLFISVHANSSQDPDARGVETYYLNFTSSPEALEVAARENIGSDKSIHELQDLVKTIALKEKIDESREFASDVETALHSGLSTKNSSIRDRGVKKAPFIVLIGANMPSILAEISFVSNPTDERKLRTPAYRQKIAESLYHGVANYVNGLGGVKVASSKMEPTAKIEKEQAH